VRVSVLNYLHSLIISMDPSDFVNTMDARLAVSKVISWTMEPRNADVRKASQSVLIALFNLNPAEFSLLLSELPKTFQDGATRILHSHIRAANESTSDVLSPRNVASPQGQNRSRPPS
ncbi:CLIP-associating protein 2 isoform X12, partial [Biomphalaria glabrata]